jgi:hypothetical protein
VRQIHIGVVFGQLDDLFSLSFKKPVWCLRRTSSTAAIATSSPVQTDPALIALHIELKLPTTVRSGHRIFRTDLGSYLNQGALDILGKVSALKVTS